MNLPERTTDSSIAENFAKSAIVVSAIRRTSLIKGRGTEGGRAVKPEAPIEGMDWQPYGTSGGPRLPNAD